MSDAQTAITRFDQALHHAARRLGLCLLVASYLCGAAPMAEAQSAPQDLPAIEVTYTRIVTVHDGDAWGGDISPDGRWVAFMKNIGQGVSHIWMVSSEGGEPFPVTSGPTYDDGVKWFPGGDRIAYRSGDRIASLAIDPRTGRPIGGPQRVTLESSNAYFCISPDGRWIAYTPRNQEADRVIRVVPSIGGAARTLTEANTSGCSWTPDGEGIYFKTGRLESPHQALMRVGIDGGPPDTVFTHPGTFSTELVAGRVLLFLQSRSNTPVTGPEIVATLDGQPLGSLKLMDGMGGMDFSRDGRTMVSHLYESVNPIRVLSLTDGEPRTVNEADSRLVGWAPDSDGLLFQTVLDGRRAVFRQSVSGGTMTEVRFPETPVGFRITDLRQPIPHNLVLSGDGRSLLYAVPGEDPSMTTLKVLDLTSGRTRVLTDRNLVAGAFMSERVFGPGGTGNRSEDEFFFWERVGSGVTLMAAGASTEPRVLWAFDDPEETRSVSVHGDRVAYVENVRQWANDDNEASILVAHPGEDTPRRILTVEGWLDELTWSPDGDWLAATHYRSDGSAVLTVMVVRVGESGELIGEPSFRPVDARSRPQWLPDGSGFLATSGGEVWLVPVDPSSEPVSLTDEEQDQVGEFILSPDGRHIAYTPHIFKGSSLWLIDFGDALVGRR